jgi:hypothetical protein
MAKEHVTETPDTSYIKNVDVTHEVSDVYIGGIARFVIALAVLMIASIVLMWGLFRLLDKSITEPPRPPMALSDKERMPPEPRLQGAPGFAESLEKTAPKQEGTGLALGRDISAGAPAPKDPLWEIRLLHQQWDDVLKHGPKDQNGQRYGMPIDKAKEEVLKQLEQQKTEGSKSASSRQ